MRRIQLTKIQILERANRKHRAMLMRGLPTPKGTKPYQYVPVGEPWYKPAPRQPMPGLGIAELQLNLYRLFGLRRPPKIEVPGGDYKDK